MRLLAALLLAALGGFAFGDEQAVQRALIQRDQQSAEFAARAQGADTAALERLHARQLLDTLRPADPQMHGYQRQKMSDERALVLAPPSVTLEKPVERPLPLPGGPRHGVDPIPAQDFRN
jgi:hypothetical protein